MTSLAGLALAVAFGIQGGNQPAVARALDTLRVVVVVDDVDAHRSLIRGATLGAEEATHTGQLFGQSVTMVVVGRAGLDSMTRAAGRAEGRPAPSIYVIAGDSLFCSQFMQQSAPTSAPLLDAGCAGVGATAPTAFSVDSRPPVPPAPADSTRLELWHPSLERFGAEQLNQRYRRRFGDGMDSDAWAGWFAMKVSLDLALRAHSVSPSALLEQLADPRGSFDGQKGRPLRFAPVSRRLVQPMYRVAGAGDASHVVAEVAP